MYITSEDIAIRIAKRYMYWTQGKPSFILEGDDKSFGTLEMACAGEIVKTWRLYIPNMIAIENIVNEAVTNFTELINAYQDIRG